MPASRVSGTSLRTAEHQAGVRLPHAPPSARTAQAEVAPRQAQFGGAWEAGERRGRVEAGPRAAVHGPVTLQRGRGQPDALPAAGAGSVPLRTQRVPGGQHGGGGAEQPPRAHTASLQGLAGAWHRSAAAQEAGVARRAGVAAKQACSLPETRPPDTRVRGGGQESSQGSQALRAPERWNPDTTDAAPGRARPSVAAMRTRDQRGGHRPGRWLNGKWGRKTEADRKGRWMIPVWPEERGGGQPHGPPWEQPPSHRPGRAQGPDAGTEGGVHRAAARPVSLTGRREPPQSWPGPGPAAPPRHTTTPWPLRRRRGAGVACKCPVSTPGWAGLPAAPGRQVGAAGARPPAPGRWRCGSSSPAGAGLPVPGSAWSWLGSGRRRRAQAWPIPKGLPAAVS